MNNIGENPFANIPLELMTKIIPKEEIGNLREVNKTIKIFLENLSRSNQTYLSAHFKIEASRNNFLTDQFSEVKFKNLNLDENHLSSAKMIGEHYLYIETCRNGILGFDIYEVNFPENSPQMNVDVKEKKINKKRIKSKSDHPKEKLDKNKDFYFQAKFQQSFPTARAISVHIFSEKEIITRIDYGGSRINEIRFWEIPISENSDKAQLIEKKGLFPLADDQLFFVAKNQVFYTIDDGTLPYIEPQKIAIHAAGSEKDEIFSTKLTSDTRITRAIQQHFFNGQLFIYQEPFISSHGGPQLHKEILIVSKDSVHQLKYAPLANLNLINAKTHFFPVYNDNQTLHFYDLNNHAVAEKNYPKPAKFDFQDGFSVLYNETKVQDEKGRLSTSKTLTLLSPDLKEINFTVSSKPFALEKDLLWLKIDSNKVLLGFEGKILVFNLEGEFLREISHKKKVTKKQVRGEIVLFSEYEKNDQRFAMASSAKEGSYRSLDSISPITGKKIEVLTHSSSASRKTKKVAEVLQTNTIRLAADHLLYTNVKDGSVTIRLFK